jgi:hypothetical protein
VSPHLTGACSATGRIPLLGEMECHLDPEHEGKHEASVTTRRRWLRVRWEDGEDLSAAVHDWFSGGYEDE